MCFGWFKKDKVEEVVEEVPVERKSVDDLVQSIQDLVVQLNLVVEDNKKLEEKIKQLEQEKQNEYEATCKAKDQVIELLNEKAELERILKEIMDLAKGK